jgi:hypothetical protein
MTRLRVWRCIGENDLEYLGTCSPLVALFMLDEDVIVWECVSGTLQGLLLSHRQLLMAI